MSEVIVRMEKVPKNCDDSCWGYLSGECPWSGHMDGYRMDYGRPRNCPIVCVLPEEHGDLIDRDYLRKYGMMYRDGIDEGGLIYVPLRDVTKSISNAPTIIAAERKET